MVNLNYFHQTDFGCPDVFIVSFLTPSFRWGGNPQVQSTATSHGPNPNDQWQQWDHRYNSDVFLDQKKRQEPYFGPARI